MGDILGRANVKALCEFLAHGVEDETENISENYSDRLKEVHKNQKQIVDIYDEKGEDSRLNQAIDEMLYDYENIYMELGVKAGFALAKDIFITESIMTDEKVQYQKMYLTLFAEVTKALDTLQKAQKNVEEMYLK